jgi:lysophospholipase L1-like esterase
MRAGRRVGWARRLAERLSGTSSVPCEFTNLARDGASVADVLANQVGQVEPAADLVSVTVGMNDIRIPRYSEQDFADRIANLLDRLTSTGATVLTCTLPDIANVVPLPPEHVEIARGRLRQASDVIRAQSARTGALCLDIWAMGELTANPLLFTEDRLHPNPTGHSLLAEAFAGLLPRLPGSAGNASRPRPRSAAWCESGRD